MHPIERLRYVARAGEADPSLLAAEAADALGSLAFEPRAIVPACRRLLDAHPSCAQLWWVAAHVLVAHDPFEEARRIADLLEDDATSEELAASFRAGATVALGARAGLLDAVASRPDLDILVVGSPERLRRALRRLDTRRALGVVPEEADAAVAQADLVVLEPVAGGPPGFLLDEADADLVAAALGVGTELWVTAGVGRLLPTPLFDALAARCRRAPDADADRFGTGPARTAPVLELLDAALVARVIGPTGPMATRAALEAAACPVPSELLAPVRSA